MSEETRSNRETAQDLAELAFNATNAEEQERFIRMGTLFAQLAQIEVQVGLSKITEQALYVEEGNK